MAERSNLPSPPRQHVPAANAPGAVAPGTQEGALYGEILRPPRLAWDGQRYTGAWPERVDLDAARRHAGVVCVVHQGACVGVVAVSALHARQAAELVEVRWAAAPAARRHEPPAASAGQGGVLSTYDWSAAAGGPDTACQVTAWCHEAGVTVWIDQIDATACGQELALLTGVPANNIRIEQSAPRPGQGADPRLLDKIDAAAAASLLSRAAGAPVSVTVGRFADHGRVQLQVPVQHGGDATESAGAGPVLTINLPAPWAERPSLARLLSQGDEVPSRQPLPLHTPYTGVVLRPQAWPGEGARTPPTGQQLQEAQTFALESQLDEQAAAAGIDPLDYRLQRIGPGRARDLLQAVARRAGWGNGHGGEGRALVTGVAADARLRGRGIAFAQAARNASATADTGLSWSAWVADVAVDPASGEVEVTRVVVGHDSQALAPAALQETVAENGPLLAAAQRLLRAPAFDDWGHGAAAEPSGLSVDAWGAGVPSVFRQNTLPAPVSTATVSQGSLQQDGVLTLPATAAIANAVYQATGVRLRSAPIDRHALREALQAQSAGAGAVPKLAKTASPARTAKLWLAGAATAAAGVLVAAWPAKPALPLTAGPDASLYSAEALARGRLVAAAGDCVVCHTAPGGVPNAGGLALDTPFGTIYTTNITPDKETGIGRWSFAAFDRAMRQGVHQDGRQLYPAFPYTAFAKISEPDMQALYGYLMSEPPVAATVPETQLTFPYSLRPMMAGWNALFHDASPYVPDPNRSAEWNRGAYLVQGAGHCGACHTPRNALGAEKTGLNFLAGADVEGWHAPALNALGSGPTPWSTDELYRYLSTGYSARHGVAAGPMAPVIHGLAQLPQSDVRAMAHYLTSLDVSSPAQAPAVLPAAPLAPVEVVVSKPPRQTEVSAPTLRGERLYQNACAVCHEAGEGPTLFGAKPLLTHSASMHLAQPDNLIQVILHGIQDPASSDLGYMPGFKDSLDDRQVGDLLGYLQRRFAPDARPWANTAARVGELRQRHPAAAAPVTAGTTK